MTPVPPWVSLQRALAARRRPLAALLAGLAVLCGLSALRPPGPPSVLVLAAARDLAAGSALTLADLRAVALPAAAVPAGVLRPGAEVLGRMVAGPVRAGEPLTDVRLVGPGLLAALAPGTVAVPVRLADPGTAALLRAGDRIDVLAAPEDPYAAGLAPARPPPALDDPAGRGGGPGGDLAGPGGEPGGDLAGLGGGPGGDRAGPGGGPGGGPAGPGARDSPAAARVVASDVVVLAVPAPPDGAAGAGDGTLVVLACPPAVARTLAAAAVGARLSPALRPPAAPAPEAPP